jgi:ParB family chromosome partitioning protein
MPKKPAQRLDALAGLFGDTEEPGTELAGARALPLALIAVNPAQPRQVFDAEALDELAASIRQHGVLQPIVVRPHGDGYQVVAGERRRRAAELAGLTEIPAIVRELDDTQAAVLTALENLQREDLDIEDEARQYEGLIALTGWSGRELARHLGKQRDYVNRRLALMQRPYLFEQIRAGDLTVKQALAHIAAVAQLPLATVTYDTEDVVTPGASTLSLDSEETPQPVERPVLDAEQAPSPNVQRPTSNPPPPTPAEAPDVVSPVPFRRRPVDQFMTWVGRVDRRGVPPPERPALRRQIAELRAWLDRWERELSEEEE